VDAADAIANKDLEYLCPKCQETITYRVHTETPDFRRLDHFAHRSRPGRIRTCVWAAIPRGETEIHQHAKAYIADYLLAVSTDSRSPPRLRTRCTLCPLKRRRRVTYSITLPSDFAVGQEVPLPTGHIADVAVHVDGEPALVIEVRVGHKVTDEKAAALDAAKIDWIEVDGLVVLEQAKKVGLRKPPRWSVLRYGAVFATEPPVCGRCHHEGATDLNGEVFEDPDYYAARQALTASGGYADYCPLRSGTTLAETGCSTVAQPVDSWYQGIARTALELLQEKQTIYVMDVVRALHLDRSERTVGEVRAALRLLVGRGILTCETVPPKLHGGPEWRQYYRVIR
jgi:hypothetical protein